MKSAITARKDVLLKTFCLFLSRRNIHCISYKYNKELLQKEIVLDFISEMIRVLGNLGKPGFWNKLHEKTGAIIHYNINTCTYCKTFLQVCFNYAIL